jgi:hypothetical protein
MQYATQSQACAALAGPQVNQLEAIIHGEISKNSLYAGLQETHMGIVEQTYVIL